MGRVVYGVSFIGRVGWGPIVGPPEPGGLLGLIGDELEDVGGYEEGLKGWWEEGAGGGGGVRKVWGLRERIWPSRKVVMGACFLPARGRRGGDVVVSRLVVGWFGLEELGLLDPPVRI